MEISELVPILNLDVFSLFDLVVGMSEDPDRDLDNRELDKIRYGVETDFDLLTVKSGNFVPKPKANAVIIDGQVIRMKDFNSEMQLRKSKAIGLFLKAVEQKDILKSR